MTAAVPPDPQLRHEVDARRRHVVLLTTRGRFGLAAVGMAVLAAARLLGVAQVSWAFIVALALAAGAAHYALYRVVRDTPFRPW
ncbi:MAG: hypothetical protein ACREMV_04065, partial [Gemmatimonadales bacterium]